MLLDSGQIQFFDKNGYLVIPRAIGGALLSRLQESTTRLIAGGNVLGPADAGPDYQFADGPNGPNLFRVDYLHAKGESAPLELLGSPTVLDIAASLAGRNFVPTYEALVFKAEGDGKEIRWHQDAVHPRTHRIFNIDIYLDVSRKDGGALRAIPGSHQGETDFCALKQHYGWEPPGVLQVEMEPGDILVHDVMLAHGSEPTVGGRLRRTLYYEFRAAEQIVSEGPWDRSFIDRRLRLIPLSIAEYQRRHPSERPFDWRPGEKFRPHASSDQDAELRVVHQVHTPGAFCSAGDVIASPGVTGRPDRAHLHPGHDRLAQGRGRQWRSGSLFPVRKGGLRMSIEAYCTAVSVYPGEIIEIQASCGESANVQVDIRRFPFDDVITTLTGECGHHPVPQDASSRGCGWPTLAALRVEPTWESDVYRADLRADTGDTTEVYFIVKAKEPASRILLAVATATYDAYNSWPSRDWPGNNESLYDHDSPTRARRVSLHRPNLVTPEVLPRWELAFAKWAAREKLALDYCTSIDLHRDPGLLSRYQLLLSVGHDEYWSKEMRDHVENFVANGGNAAFFSGNTCMWQIRFEDQDSSIVCYRDALEDPLTGIDDQRVTAEWYSSPVNRPTNTLTGVGFQQGAGFGWGLAPSARQEDAAYQVCFPEHWVFENAKLEGDHTFGRGECIVGYETDAADFVEVEGVPWATGRDGTPENFVILATADLTAWHGSGLGGKATMGLFRRNGTVFTAATVDWARGLDIEDSAVPQITKNVVERLQRRIPSNEWEIIGTAPRFRSMARFERNLFGLGEDGQLWYREVAAQNLPWRHAGAAANVTALGSTEFWSGRLIGTRGRSLVWRTGRPGNDEWREFGELPGTECGDITATNKNIFAIADGRLWTRTAALEPAQWTPIGCGEGIEALSSWWSKLLALTNDGKIVWCFADKTGNVTWKELGEAPDDSLAIIPVDGRIIISTSRHLWWRSAK